MKNFKDSTSTSNSDKKQHNTPQNYEAPKLKSLGTWQPRTLFAYFHSSF
ncbi:MAG TPA: hypothetical protein VKA34_08755 [Balneolales bacterium]|nr:hypothetical protein [Balneolales bacterium]